MSRQFKPISWSHLLIDSAHSARLHGLQSVKALKDKVFKETYKVGKLDFLGNTQAQRQPLHEGKISIAHNACAVTHFLFCFCNAQLTHHLLECCMNTRLASCSAAGTSAQTPKLLHVHDHSAGQLWCYQHKRANSQTLHMHNHSAG